MSRETILADIASRLPVTPDPRKRTVFMVLMALGVIAFGFLLVTNPLRAWGAWTINTLYFLGIAEGGVVLAAAIRLCNGRWGGPIMRIGESLSSYMPFGSGPRVCIGAQFALTEASLVLASLVQSFCIERADTEPFTPVAK